MTTTEKKSYLVLNGFTVANPKAAEEGEPVILVVNRGDVVALDEATAQAELHRNRIAEATDAILESVRASVTAELGEGYTFQDVA